MLAFRRTLRAYFAHAENVETLRNRPYGFLATDWNNPGLRRQGCSSFRVILIGIRGARESLWESRSSPGINKGHILKECGLCLLAHTEGSRRSSIQGRYLSALTMFSLEG